MNDVKDPPASTLKDELQFLREITGGKMDDSKVVPFPDAPFKTSAEVSKAINDEDGSDRSSNEDGNTESNSSPSSSCGERFSSDIVSNAFVPESAENLREKLIEVVSLDATCEGRATDELGMNDLKRSLSKSYNLRHYEEKVDLIASGGSANNDTFDSKILCGALSRSENQPLSVKVRAKVIMQLIAAVQLVTQLLF